MLTDEIIHIIALKENKIFDLRKSNITIKQHRKQMIEALEDIRRGEFGQVGHSTWITEQIDHVLSSIQGGGKSDR